MLVRKTSRFEILYCILELSAKKKKFLVKNIFETVFTFLQNVMSKDHLDEL